MGARVYDPTLGRFLSTDSVPGGSANNYDYVDQDPLNQYDLAGTCAHSYDVWCQSKSVAHHVKVTVKHDVIDPIIRGGKWTWRKLKQHKEQIETAAKFAVGFVAGLACEGTTMGGGTPACIAMVYAIETTEGLAEYKAKHPHASKREVLGFQAGEGILHDLEGLLAHWWATK
jgi:hypothetical protein